MNVTFKAFMQKEWTLKDDSIFIGNKTIMLSSVKYVKHNPPTPAAACGVISVVYGPGSFDFATLCYPKKETHKAEEAARYIMEFVGGQEYKDKVKAYEKAKVEGFRKRCNVCGHIFCYTFEDLEKNKQLAKSAAMHSTSALLGPAILSATNVQTADNQLNRITDYSKCPKCGSKDIADATDEDIESNKRGQQAVSAADELKKFKELLDSGVISQEEFDAKKKQLLGL